MNEGHGRMKCSVEEEASMSIYGSCWKGGQRNDEAVVRRRIGGSRKEGWKKKVV